MSGMLPDGCTANSMTDVLMAEPPVDPPQRLLIGSRADLEIALLHLIGRTRRQLRFAAADLSVLALGDVRPVTAIRAVLLAHPGNHIQLLVDDMAWLDTRAPRLRALQRDFSHALLIRRADPQDPVGHDVVGMGDERDVLRLQPTVGIRGELWCHHSPLAQPLISEFDRRWEHASHNQPSQPLGL
jgi:hypothetical protein